MTIQTFLADLALRGVTLYVKADQIYYRGPRGAWTDVDRAAIRANKAELLALLRVDIPSDHLDPTGVSPSPALPVEPDRATPPVLPSVALTCPRCGQPSRIHCRFFGRPGVWLAWCDNPGRQCNGKADIVDEADIRRAEVAS